MFIIWNKSNKAKKIIKLNVISYDEWEWMKKKCVISGRYPSSRLAIIWRWWCIIAIAWQVVNLCVAFLNDGRSFCYAKKIRHKIWLSSQHTTTAATIIGTITITIITHIIIGIRFNRWIKPFGFPYNRRIPNNFEFIFYTHPVFLWVAQETRVLFLSFSSP